MKSTALLAGIGALAISANAMALDLTPYAAVRAGAVFNQTDADASSTYKYKRTFENTMSDDKHSDTVFGARAAFGVEMNFAKYGAVRGELELNWNDAAGDDNDFDFTIKNTATHNFKTETKTYGVMANLYYDIYTGTKFTPFVGGGIGWSHAKVSSTARGELMGDAFEIGDSASDDNFAWNVGAGIAYNLNENIVLDIAYRYTDMGSVSGDKTIEMEPLMGKIISDAKFDIASHEVMVGARYRF